MLNKKIYKVLRSNLFFFLILFSVVFVLYGKSISFDFSYHDDNSLILEKTDFLSHVTNIPKLFITSCYYSDSFQYYRPILNLSFLMETSVFGLNTKIYHLTNMILFILVLYLMYVFLLKLNLDRTISKVIILLLSVHPILTSSVVWIPARNDTLLTVFIFLSFVFFIKYLEKNSIKNLILYVMSFSIALFTKETALLTLFLYPIFVVCFEYKLSKKEICKNILIFLPILIIYFYLRNTSVESVGIKYYFDNPFLCLTNFITGINIYLYNLFVPYQVPIMVYNINLSVSNIILDLLLFVIIIILYHKELLSIKILFFSSVYFVIGLLATFLLQDYVYLNHRLIISSFGVVLAFVYTIDNLITKYKKITKYLIFLSVILFLYLFSYSFNLQDKYKNKYDYWSNAYSEAPTYKGCSYWMSRFLLENNDFGKAKELLDDSDPTFYSDLALIYYREGDMDKAEEFYNKSVESDINKAQCYRNLSVIYLKRDNDMNKAIEYAKLAVEEEPYDDGYNLYLQELQKLTNEKGNI